MLNPTGDVKTGKKRVFTWSQRHSWERVFRRLLADKINGDVIDKARRINPRSIADNYFAWLNSALATVTNQPSEDIPTLLAKRLSDHYEFMIGFHGTRSDSAADFLEHGIRLSDIKALNQRAVKFFGDSEALQKAILELRQCEQHDHGKIFVALTKDACLRDHPHYMLYGCEHLKAIAERLGRTAELAARGKPLIVECLIPISTLESDSRFWRGRSYAILEDFFKRVLHPSKSRRVNPSCEIITQPIRAENILRVHEFTEIKRTFLWKNYLTDALEESVETVLRPFKIWPGKAKLPLSSISK